MKNNTKVRLHLSKQLFESLTREIIKEAKANDGYTEAVKQPKQPKQSKSQATSPEVQKTDKEKTEGLDPANIGPGGVVVDDDNWHQNGKKEAAPIAAKQSGPATTGTLRKNLLKHAQDVPKLSGISSKEVAGLQKLLNTILAKAPSGELAMAIDKAQRALDISTQNIKAGDQKSSGTAQQTHSPGSDYTQGSFMGKRGEEKPSKFTSGVAKPAANQRFEEMETKVAEEGQMNEMTDAVSWEAVAAAMTAMGLAPLAIDKMHKWWEKKYPKSFKAAQKISGTIDRQMGGNTPGQGHGVDTSKTFGPQNEKNALKEYENDDYRVVNGQCRRYNDEHEYTVVSMSYCR